MCLHAARLPARLDASGELRPFFEQDRSRWDRALVTEGQRLLEHSAFGLDLTEYHVEAAIAWAHANAHGAEDTDWPMIVSFYDKLMAIRPSPVVALNRAIAIGQDKGPLRGLQELHAIRSSKRLAKYPFYYATLGEFEHRDGKNDAAVRHFTAALALARNPAERHFLEQRIRACECTVHAG